jgi:hypothetical protein
VLQVLNSRKELSLCLAKRKMSGNHFLFKTKQCLGSGTEVTFGHFFFKFSFWLLNKVYQEQCFMTKEARRRSVSLLHEQSLKNRHWKQSNKLRMCGVTLSVENTEQLMPLCIVLTIRHHTRSTNIHNLWHS